jgi:four helix bundle protein
MKPHRDLALADAAEQLSADVVRLSDRTRRLLHRTQLLKSAQAVNANVGEAFGRVSVADRNYRLSVARAESEETIRHLRSNVNAERISERAYWPLHNRLVTIVKMINSLLY